MVAFAGAVGIMEHPAFTGLHKIESPAFGYPASVWKTAQLRQVLQVLEPLDARDLVLAEVELAQHDQRRQVLQLEDAVVLDRQLLQQHAPN